MDTDKARFLAWSLHNERVKQTKGLLLNIDWCPFCHKTELLIYYDEDVLGGYRVMCALCGTQGPATQVIPNDDDSDEERDKKELSAVVECIDDWNYMSDLDDPDSEIVIAEYECRDDQGHYVYSSISKANF